MKAGHPSHQWRSPAISPRSQQARASQTGSGVLSLTCSPTTSGIKIRALRTWLFVRSNGRRSFLDFVVLSLISARKSALPAELLFSSCFLGVN